MFKSLGVLFYSLLNFTWPLLYPSTPPRFSGLGPAFLARAHFTVILSIGLFPRPVPR